MADVAILQGERDDGSMRFAAIDPTARYCQSRTAPLRFAALLTPFTSERDAREALAQDEATAIVAVARKVVRG